jgi:hypothetical protein
MGRQQQLWNSKEYSAKKYEQYKIFETYLGAPPTTLCEIGCGFAYEAGYFNKDHSTQIWLQDVDEEYTQSNEKTKRYRDYGEITDFGGYNSFANINDSLKSRGMTDYKLLERQDPRWQQAPAFDIIMSVKSMGFHYPITEYKSFIAEHSHVNTRLFVTVRDTRRSPDRDYIIKNVVYEHGTSRSGLISAFVELESVN